MKFGVVTFPGSNCDYDAYRAVIDTLGEEAVYIWHKDHDLQNSDVIILPGGFSYGDYLRPGAIARFSPVMSEIVEHARKGAPLIAICNGFQIACEAGLLPGALLRNASLQFVSAPVHLRIENSDTLFSSAYDQGDVIRVPIAHGDGRYTASESELDALESGGRVVFRYVNGNGDATDDSNPNGSSRSIAGIVNTEGNVLGLMPHPERALDDILGSHDGLGVFESILSRVAA